jgi:hypothetical protein
MDDHFGKGNFTLDRVKSSLARKFEINFDDIKISYDDQWGSRTIMSSQRDFETSVGLAQRKTLVSGGAETLITLYITQKGASWLQSGSLGRHSAILVVSCPGKDASGTEVMQQIQQMATKRPNMFIAYDWAGSTNTFTSDKPLWDTIWEEDTGEGTLFSQWKCNVGGEKMDLFYQIQDIVHKTMWFTNYKASVKNAIKQHAQKGGRVYLFCIEGDATTSGRSIGGPQSDLRRDEDGGHD